MIHGVLDFVTENLEQIDKKEFESQEFVSFKDRFQPFILLAIGLLFFDIFIFETKTNGYNKSIYLMKISG